MTTRWDAATYDRIADPMFGWGRTLLDRLPLRGDERVLDAGCGSGRVTELILDRLPRGRVIAVDASTEMIDEARRRLNAHADRLELLVADLTAPLPIREPVDHVVSTAAFHWILDHHALFASLAAALRAGGRLVAQCGGAGNLARVRALESQLGDGWTTPHLFATPEETQERLERAGFTDIHCWLHAEPTPLAAGEPLETYLRTIVLRLHLERLAEAERAPFVRAVAARLRPPVLDYVRLDIDAVRAG